MSSGSVTTNLTIYKKSISAGNMTFNEQVESSPTVDVMMILTCIITSVGIVSNLTVVIVFLHHKKLRRKIPNMFIINQVRVVLI